MIRLRGNMMLVQALNLRIVPWLKHRSRIAFGVLAGRRIENRLIVIQIYINQYPGVAAQ